MTPRIFSIRFSICFAFLMLGAGVQLPFLPLWLQAKGLTAAQIATVLAGMMAARAVASPLISYLADHFGNRRAVIQICAAFALTANIFVAQLDGYMPILLGCLAASFLFAPVFPLAEGFSVDGSAVHGLDYGRLRLWASVSFLSGSFIAGAILTGISAEYAIWLLVGGQFFSMLATFVLPPEPVVQHAPQDVQTQPSAWRLFFGSRFTIILIAVSLGQASHALLNGFSSVYWTSLGISTLVISLFWMGAVLMEVVLFAFSNRVIARVGVMRLICIGLGCGVLRWTGMAFVTSVPLMAGLQMLHAVTFACTHLGTMHYLRLSVPPRMRNRAQGIYSAISSGLFMASVTWATGPIYQKYGGEAFLFMSAISLAAFAIAYFTVRFSPKGALVPGA
jgi:MFS transporter, PPP family, 3-phenylpropionic acid transporter